MFDVAALSNFLTYLAAALALFGLTVSIYLRLTPHAELQLIRSGNTAAAIAMAGAMLGLALPLASTVLHSDSLIGMVLWATVGMVAQGMAYMITRLLIPDIAAGISAGRMAHAVLLANLSLSVGVINAACVS